MAPQHITESQSPSDKMSPTQENKPPIPVGAGAKKAMECYFAGTNHLEFRQRSSSASRSTRTFSRGGTPSRDAANAKTGASGCSEGAIDPEALKTALKKIPSVEKMSIRPTPPRSRSISRSNSPLPDEELLDESLPDFYKVTLKPTERTGSQTRDILLAGNRLSRDATPTRDASAPEYRRNRLSSRDATPNRDAPVPEFRRVALRRTPSREQLTDEQALKRSTLKKNTVMEASSSSTSNLSRSGSFTSLTAINKTVLSRRNSFASEEKPQPDFKGVVLKKTGSRPGSRAGSPTRLEKSASRGELAEKSAASLKKVESAATSRSASRRSSATSETTAEFANVSLKKSKKVKGDQSKFQVEQVSLKPIPVGEGEETTQVSSSSAGTRHEERAASSSSVTRQRVERETKFVANDEEYHDIKSSLDKLKKKDSRAASPDADSAEAKKRAPPKDASPPEDAAAKPVVYRRPKKLPLEEEEAEKVHLKPVNREKRMSFTSSIECVKKAAEDEENEAKRNERPPLLRKASFTSSLDNIAIGGEERAEKVHLSCYSKEMGSQVDLTRAYQESDEKREEENKSERAPLLRKMSFTSSLDNIAIAGEEREKVHLSCFSREMGSNVDLVQVCQDQGEGKHEVKLEFEIEGKEVKENEQRREAAEEKWAASVAEVEEVEAAVEKRLSWLAAVDGDVDERSPAEQVEDVIEEAVSATVATVNGSAGVRLGDDDEESEEEEESEEIIEEVTTKREEVTTKREEVTTELHKLRKAPSIDGLFQRQDVQAAFTFTLPCQNDEATTKLSLELPSLS